MANNTKATTKLQQELEGFDVSMNYWKLNHGPFAFLRCEIKCNVHVTRACWCIYLKEWVTSN